MTYYSSNYYKCDYYRSNFYVKITNITNGGWPGGLFFADAVLRW